MTRETDLAPKRPALPKKGARSFFVHGKMRKEKPNFRAEAARNRGKSAYFYAKKPKDACKKFSFPHSLNDSMVQ